MENILLILSFLSSIISIVTVVLYTSNCYNLQVMIDSIDQNGILTETEVPLHWYLTNMHTVECWTISLPDDEKYLKYEIVTRTWGRVQLCRKIMVYTLPIMIICGFTLLILLS